MQEQRAVLTAFLQQQLAAQGFTPNPKIINALHLHLELTVRPPNESEEVRTVHGSNKILPATSQPHPSSYTTSCKSPSTTCSVSSARSWASSPSMTPPGK